MPERRQARMRRSAVALAWIVTAAATAGLAAAPAAAVTAGQPRSVPNEDIGGARLASHGIVVSYPSRGAGRLPAVPASAYVIADANTGAVLAAKDAHGLFPPASTLKVLTAITMLPLLNPDAMVAASKRAASAEPNIVGLIPGRKYKVADLFRALLLISANDAAVALVQASGSFSQGMGLVNAEALHLQAYDVVAKQPNGLPAPGQVVSAYDLALIARQALAMPAFMRYDSTRTARFPITPRKTVTLVNQNYLLTQYRGGIGGKIGWTIKAEATYIGLARRNGVTLIVTILHATPLTEIGSAEELLDWGFSNAGKVRPVGVLVPPLAAPSTAAEGRNGSGASSAGGSTAGPAAGPAGGSAHAARTQRAARGAATASGTRGPAGWPTAGIGLAAALGVALLGGLAWLRRRALLARRPGESQVSGPGGSRPGL